MVLLAKEEPRHSDTNVVAARAIGVAVLLEVFSCGFVSKDLTVQTCHFVITDMRVYLLCKP